MQRDEDRGESPGLQVVGDAMGVGLEGLVRHQEHRDGPHGAVHFEQRVVHERDNDDEHQLPDHVHRLPIARLLSVAQHQEGQRGVFQLLPPDLAEEHAQSDQERRDAGPINEDEHGGDVGGLWHADLEGGG